ncbi:MULTISPECIES: S41 family peptidase [Streptococcus]|nr:S41 family peptidase [Streptococcus anginosus]MCW1058963.1 S41 family peptidase [Streptococcus anginosus]MDU3554476.1 S41 family peptidase [Streptococcus anginosus]MDX5003298.1 S41 family peptidase [Streptococcus anginosus]MDX5024988.1 S41 family peptidase [Streptococcus anginosus]MDX5033012.1 S41 family peptidase [Streptococcus anginosus]
MKKGCIGCLGVLGVLFLAVLGAVLYFGPNYDIYLLPPSPEQYAKSALNKMNSALYIDENWSQEKEKALKEVKSAKTYADTYPVLKRMTKLSGGKHSYFYTPKEFKTSQKEESRLPVIKNENDILYLKLPPFMGNEKEAKAYRTMLHQALTKETYKGVIVDLENNSGGNMYPMIGGLAAILSNGTLFQFEYANGQKIGTTLSQILASKQTEEKNSSKTIPIAILVNGNTASSGEMTTLAFKGLPNVKIFGKPTAGYTTGNMVYSLYDGATIQLTVSRIIDRKGNRYENTPIEPDIATTTPLNDARTWLLEQISK